MPDMINRLKASGCDIEIGLTQAMYDLRFYRQLLMKFVKDPSIAILDQAVEEGSVSQAIESAHELKGTTATLGLTPVNREISHFLDSIRDSADITEEDMKNKYQRVDKEIQHILALIQG